VAVEREAAAPASTKNAEGERAPEMRPKKTNPWFFGMKADIDVDADSALVHTITTAAANESDVEQLGDLLHRKEEQVCAGSATAAALRNEQARALPNAGRLRKRSRSACRKDRTIRRFRDAVAAPVPCSCEQRQALPSAFHRVRELRVQDKAEELRCSPRPRRISTVGRACAVPVRPDPAPDPVPACKCLSRLYFLRKPGSDLPETGSTRLRIDIRRM
jgi:hypothetical protein